MAITQSAKKAIRTAEKKRIFNLRRKDALRDTTKAFIKMVGIKDVIAARKLLPAAYAAIDKALKRGVIKANTASRKKSSLARALAKIST